MRRPCLMLAFTAMLATHGAQSAPPAGNGRFQLEGQLRPEPAARGDGRFAVRALLVPAASRPDSAERFAVAAKLEPENKAICTPTTEIFSDGFEGP